MRLKDKLAQEKSIITSDFQLRREFRQRVSRMEEIYIDICDDEGKEPTTIGFIDFCGGYES